MIRKIQKWKERKKGEGGNVLLKFLSVALVALLSFSSVMMVERSLAATQCPTCKGTELNTLAENETVTRYWCKKCRVAFSVPKSGSSPTTPTTPSKPTNPTTPTTPGGSTETTNPTCTHSKKRYKYNNGR